GAARVAPAAAEIRDRIEVAARVSQQSLAGRDLGALDERVLVFGFDLEDLLVEGPGFREESLFAQAVGDAGELLHRLVALTGADVEIAEDVGGVPVARLVLDDAQILCDGLIQLPLSEKLLGVAQRDNPIEGHGI